MNKEKKIGIYIAGSIALAASAFIVMPKVIDYIADNVYSEVSNTPLDDEDYWGPEIVKREKAVNTESTEEANSNGEL